MSPAVAPPAQNKRKRGFTAAATLVMGVFIAPLALGIVFNSYGTPDMNAYIRMAFAQVVGATIAMVTAAGVVAQRVFLRKASGDIAWFSLIALVVTLWQVSVIMGAATALLQRLGN